MKWEDSLASLSHKRLDSTSSEIGFVDSYFPICLCSFLYTEEQSDRVCIFVFADQSANPLTSGFVFVMDKPQDFRNKDKFKLHSLSSAVVLEPVLNYLRGRMEQRKGNLLAQNSRDFVLT